MTPIGSGTLRKIPGTDDYDGSVTIDTIPPIRLCGALHYREGEPWMKITVPNRITAQGELCLRQPMRGTLTLDGYTYPLSGSAEVDEVGRYCAISLYSGVADSDRGPEWLEQAMAKDAAK